MQNEIHKLRTRLRKFALDPFVDGMHLTAEVSDYSFFSFFNCVKVSN